MALYIIPKYELYLYIKSLKIYNTNNALKFEGTKKYRIEAMLGKHWQQRSDSFPAISVDIYNTQQGAGASFSI